MLAGFACGCGADSTGDRQSGARETAAAPTARAAPAAGPAQGPVARAAAATGTTAKSDLRQAVSLIESHRADSEAVATGSDLSALASVLPGSVTVGRSDAYGYALSASTAYGATFTIERSGSTWVRGCAPLDPVDCRTGTW